MGCSNWHNPRFACSLFDSFDAQAAYRGHCSTFSSDQCVCAYSWHGCRDTVRRWNLGAKRDVLIVLSNPDIELEYERLQGQLHQTEHTYIAFRDQLNSDNKLDDLTRQSLRRERVTVEEKVRSLKEQLRLLEQKRDLLTIRSPQDGRVVTWDITRQLLNRPLEPGQFLLTVAADKGPWELELKIPDKYAGYASHASSRFLPFSNLILHIKSLAA